MKYALMLTILFALGYHMSGETKAYTLAWGEVVHCKQAEESVCGMNLSRCEEVQGYWCQQSVVVGAQ